jgi:hypothetical protein
MVEQKKKPATKKVAAVKSKATKAAATPVAKKAAPKKTVAAVSEPKKPKAPAVKKVSAPAAKTTKTPAKQAATTKAKSQAAENKAAVQPTPEERYRMVETAAYFIAEQHGFQGRSDEHWAAAERAIAAKLSK